MSRVKQEYLDRTYYALENNQQNYNAHRRRFQDIDYGDQTPVDSKQLDDVPQGKVIISQDVFEQLLTINNESEKARAEFSYLLTGITEGQTVRFDQIAWCRNQGNSQEADFSPLLKNLNAYINAVKQTGETQAIVCNGHTHPKNMSKYAEDFSAYDMAGYMQMKEENAVFKNGDVSLCGGIMSDMNLNFCFYDDNMQNFYKFNDVVLETETGEQIPLSCYDRKISKEEISKRLLQLEEDKPKTMSFRDSLRQGAPSLEQQAELSAYAQRRMALQRALEEKRESTTNERS